jgi:Tfp pilus assembly protein PilO
MNWLQLQAWWQVRTLRERMLVLVGGTAALLIAVDTSWTVPLEQRLKRERAEQQTQRTLAEARHGAADLPGGEALALKAQEQRLRERLVAAQADLHALELRAAETTRLPEMLRAIAATVGPVRLLALDLSADGGAGLGAAPSAAASAPAAMPPATAAAAPVRRLYRLPITIQVSGSYDDLSGLLTQIEHHAPALQWSLLSLDGSDWPSIRMTLKAHVPSLSARWGSS